MINSLQMELYSRLIDFYHDRVSCDKLALCLFRNSSPVQAETNLSLNDQGSQLNTEEIEFMRHYTKA